MNGLHSCKPGNEPQVGQVKTFVIQQFPAANGKRAWTKIKAANAENGGQPYKILSAKPTGHTDSYGNISFNIDVEPANGVPSAMAGLSTPPASQRGNGDDRSSRIERQHSQEQAIRYATLKGLTSITTEELRELTSWFQRDISHSPSAPVTQQPEPPPQPEPDDDEDIPF